MQIQGKPWAQSLLFSPLFLLYQLLTKLCVCKSALLAKCKKIQVATAWPRMTRVF